MRCRAVFSLALLGLSLAPAGADHRPLIYPDGVVVHGDWGLHRPGHIVPFVDDFYGYYIYAPRNPAGYYFPSNIGDPNAYRSRATRQPSVPGPYYRRNWSTGPALPADVPPQVVPEGPYVIPAPELAPEPDLK